MAKLGMYSLALGFAAIMAVAVGSHADAAAPCKRTTFDTVMVKDACAQGGQKAAKDAMKKFLREAKKKDADLDCGSCHSKLSPNYPLKPDGLKAFKDLGGK